VLSYEYAELKKRGPKALSENNYFRFIVDNIEGAQHMYEEAVHAFEKVAGETASNEEIAYILTAIQLGSVLFLLIIVDFLVSSFYTRQGNSLNLFRLIPTKKVKEIVANMNNELNGAAGDTGAVVDDGAIEDTSGWFNGVNRFRVRYVIFFFILTVISVIFSVYNGTNITSFGQDFSVMTAIGDTKCYGTIAATMATEAARPDDIAWETEERLRVFLMETAYKLNKAHGYLLFGDLSTNPPGYAHDEMSDHMKEVLLHPGCLPKNQTICKDMNRYNATIGLTKNLLESGLIRVIRSVTQIIGVIKVQAETDFTPDKGHIEFLKELIDNVYVDGLENLLGVEER
jgi:hypothetical protein